VSHNSAQSCSDNIPSQPPDNHHNWMLSIVEGRGSESTRIDYSKL